MCSIVDILASVVIVCEIANLNECERVFSTAKKEKKLRERERDREKDLATMLDMNESGSPYLKANRKDHMFPIKGHPISPGGSGYCSLPNLLT